MTQGTDWTLWIFGIMALGAMYAVLMQFRWELCKRVRLSLCRGEEQHRYYPHLPSLRDMTYCFEHWNKWGVHSWMRWAEKKGKKLNEGKTLT